LRVAGGQKGPAVVTVCQRQINGCSSFFVIVDSSDGAGLGSIGVGVVVEVMV